MGRASGAVHPASGLPTDSKGSGLGRGRSIWLSSDQGEEHETGTADVGRRVLAHPECAPRSMHCAGMGVPSLFGCRAAALIDYPTALALAPVPVGPVDLMPLLSPLPPHSMGMWRRR